MTAVAEPITRRPAGAARSRFRPDIQGLRAIAVLLVILYHAHVPGIRGGYVGVDVFFVISGFLISGQLLRGRINFTAFYAQRMRRLLPAALLVIVVTVAVARVVLPPLQVKALVTHAVYSALYAVNYRLAAEGVDYQQASAAASPLQHYWSLAVEEQFYLVWPLLIALCFGLGRRHGRQVAAAAFVVVFAVSLYASVRVTAADTSLAYFAIHTRAWELAAGALVAVFATRLRRLPALPAEVLVWAGLAAIVASGLLYTDATAYPGYAALLPVAGAALVIGGGCAGQFPRVAAVLGRRPMQGIGKVSYGWYLWHWPALMLLPAVFGEAFGWGRNLEACLIALWLAVLTYFIVERPTRLSRLRRPAWLGVGILASGAAVAASLLVLVSLPVLTGAGKALQVVTADGSANPAYLLKVGNAIRGSALIHTVPRNLTPDLASAAHDYPETSFSQGCHANFLDIGQGPCVFGDPHGTHTVVLVGDSHMEQWEPAFAEAAKREHWRVVSWTKSACPLMNRPVRNDQLNREYTECQAWRDSTVGRIVRLRPDLVVAGQSDSVTGRAFTDADYVRNTVETLDKFRRAGLRVRYMLDIIYPAVDVPVCVSAHLTDATACAQRDFPGWTGPRRQALENGLTAGGYPFTDPQPWQCSDTVCPALIGNLLVYRDASHFTATFSRWLAPMVEPMLKP